MYSSPLISQLKQAYKIFDNECARMIPLFEALEVKKNEHLFGEGDIVRYIYFVEKGSLRQYYINNNGEERTIYFKVENGWASELVSFLDNTPTELNLQALENSEMQIVNEKNWVYAVTQIHSFRMGFIRVQQDTNYLAFWQTTG
jgi:CRP-like cAMP-binding protein